MTTLQATPNRFGGIVAEPASLPTGAEEFGALLTASLAAWRAEDYRVAWLEIPVDRARLVPVAVEAGFSFHHTGDGYLMLTLALQPEAFIPGHASHYIGAGGVVLTEAHELLVVAEKYYRTPGQPLRFKLPGGALHPGEHLADGVAREILEETGVRTRFEALICFRHWHGYRYGKSDIYFVCRLRPLSREITIQEDEIAECRWMPVQKYLDSSTVSPFNKRVVQAAAGSRGLVPEAVEGYEDRERYEVFMPPEPGEPRA